MTGWSWRAYDLATGAATADLALAGWSHEDILDDAGQFTASLACRSVLLDRTAITATLPTRSLIVPVRDGLPLGYAGVVWRADQGTIGGASLLSYFDTQTYDDTHTFANVDQHTMMKFLVDWVQANGGNIGVDTSQVGTSGVQRDQTWYVWEQKNVGDAIRQKGDNIGGYDFDFRVELDAGELVRRMRMWTPRRGRPFQAQTSPVFTVGRNAMVVPAAPTDGTGMATHVIAVGAETGVTFSIGDAQVRERLVARTIRFDLLAAGFPRIVKVLDRPDVKEASTLQEHADGYASFYGAVAVDQIVLEVDPDDVTWPWWTWELGDDCQLIIPDTVSWWPDGFNDIRRIVSNRWTVDGSGEHLQVTTGRLLPT